MECLRARVQHSSNMFMAAVSSLSSRVVCLVPKICISSVFYIKALDVVDSFILCNSDRSLPNILISFLF